MATKVVMAQLSPTMEEGKLVEWKVSEGDEVAQGDVVAEIETDKANMEVEAMGAGVLRKILVQEGETVPVGALIGVIAAPDEDIDDLIAGAGAPAPAAAVAEEEEEEEGEEEEEAEEETEEEAEEKVEGGAARKAAEEGAEEPAAAAEAGDRAEERAGTTEGEEERAGGARRAPEGRAAEDGRVKASPVARRIADEEGLDLASISGSGPGGRIVKADVEAALAARTGEAEAEAAPEEKAAEPTREPRAPAPTLESRVEEASQMRKAIARRLVQSIGPVPHFFLTTEIDMERALELRAALNARLEDGKIGVTDLLLKTAAEALARHPEVNASWDDDAIRYHGRVDLGIAVAVDGGLITPVLRDASGKGLRTIAREARDLIERARARKLAPEEYQGATFSVSNLGMYDIDQFTAIINPPEAAILAVGKTQEKPVVVEGEVVVRKRMRVTMSCDHRAVDGATGAAFLETFKAMLENPLEMVL